MQKLSPHSSLIIGCTVRPKFMLRRSLQEAAMTMDVNVEMMDLSAKDHIHWEKLDGILIPGGPDINPCYYLPSIEKDLREHTKALDHLIHYTAEGKKRDAFEHALLMEYFHSRTLKDLPILGICRGMQMLAVAQGIPLLLDIKEELGITHPRLSLDKIEVTDQDSHLRKIVGGESLRAVKLQHQAIRTDYFFLHQDRWPHIKLTAFSHDQRLVEAMEFTDRPVLGVQFHPEMEVGARQNKLFQWLLKEARARHEKKGQMQLMYAC